MLPGLILILAILSGAALSEVPIPGVLPPCPFIEIQQQLARERILDSFNFAPELEREQQVSRIIAAGSLFAKPYRPDAVCPLQKLLGSSPSLHSLSTQFLSIPPGLRS